MPQYKLEFMDGAIARVRESTSARAHVKAAYMRMKRGAECHRELAIVGGHVIFNACAECTRRMCPLRVGKNGPRVMEYCMFNDRIENPSHHAEPRFGGDSVDGVVGSLNQEDA